VHPTKRPRKTGYRQLTLMSLPAILLFFLFNYLPMGGIILAFKDFRYDLGILASDWVGWSNFEFFFTSQDAWLILRNTIGLNLIFLAVGLTLSVFVALLLNELRGNRLVKTYQTIMFFPYFLSWVVVSYAFYAFLSTRSGILNQLFHVLGLESVSWYTEAHYWPFILTFAAVWKGLGYWTVIFYAALIAIDQDYYEAAAIDGAGKLRVVLSVTLPMLLPIILVMALLQVGRILNADFGLFWFLPMQVGMLYETTQVIDTYVYRALSVTGDVGIGAATSLFQSTVGLLLIWGANLLVRRVHRESALF